LWAALIDEDVALIDEDKMLKPLAPEATGTSASAPSDFSGILAAVQTPD
jgi:hypothetical protein